MASEGISNLAALMQRRVPWKYPSAALLCALTSCRRHGCTEARVTWRHTRRQPAHQCPRPPKGKFCSRHCGSGWTGSTCLCSFS